MSTPASTDPEKPTAHYVLPIDESSFLDDSVLSQMMDEVEQKLSRQREEQAGVRISSSSQQEIVESSNFLSDSVLSQMMDHVENENVLTPPDETLEDPPACCYSTPIAAQTNRMTYGTQDDGKGMAVVTPSTPGGASTGFIGMSTPPKMYPRNEYIGRAAATAITHPQTKSVPPSRNVRDKSGETSNRVKTLIRNPYSKTRHAGAQNAPSRRQHSDAYAPFHASPSNQHGPKPSRPIPKNPYASKTKNSSVGKILSQKNPLDSSSQASLISKSSLDADLSGGLDDSVLCNLMERIESQTRCNPEVTTPRDDSSRQHVTNGEMGTTRKRLKFTDV